MCAFPQRLSGRIQLRRMSSSLGTRCATENTTSSNKTTIYYVFSGWPAWDIRQIENGANAPSPHRKQTLRDAALLERVRELASRIRGCAKDGIRRKLYRTSEYCCFQVVR